MIKCPLCQKRFRELEYSVLYRESLNGMNQGILVCKKCYKSVGKEGLVNWAKQVENVTWKNLEDLGLIKKSKGDVKIV